MRFEWDEARNCLNIQKHDIDFNDALDIFNHPMLSLRDDRVVYGEERWIGLGWTKPSSGSSFIPSAKAT